MKITFTDTGLEDYNYWALNDKKMMKRLIKVLEDIIRNPYEGLAKPEPLKGNLQGKWSRRLDREHRLVYQVDNKQIMIYSCRYHYDRN